MRYFPWSYAYTAICSLCYANIGTIEASVGAAYANKGTAYANVGAAYATGVAFNS